MTDPEPTQLSILLDRAVAHIVDGEDRPEQREMASAVHKAFTEGEHLAVQGPTGVGKSIAYLIPAVIAAQKGHRTVVVTSSKALQDQLASVELPFLANTLDLPFTFAVLKGRSNYLCEAAASEVRVQLGGPRQQSLDLDVGDDTDPADIPVNLGDDANVEALTEILDWAESSPTGDMAELPTSPPWRIWSMLSVGPGECVGAANCAHSAKCFAEAARDRAEDADIVVVNAHLYGAHLQMNRSLLPEHSLLVIDEAHEFEDSMVGSLSVELTAAKVTALASLHRRCVADDEATQKYLKDAANRIESALHANEPERLPDGLTDDLVDAVQAVHAATDRALTTLKVAASRSGASSVKHRVDTAIRSAESLSGDCAALLGDMGAGKVLWVEALKGTELALRLTRIDIAATLRRMAWDDDDPPTVVCCSATLDSHTPRRLGLDAKFISVPSPFDFAENAVLYVPKVHKPTHVDWPDDVVDVIEGLIRSANGRTLALFTSNRMLRATVDECRTRMPEFRILAQGDAPNPVLQAQFLDDEHSSLFATASFWTGVSSPGSTCSVVVIDKIPFPVPTDPIIEARSELAGDAAFMEVSVPAAGMQLAQGVGRLIRTATDRGVVAVCDPRLAEARYRNRILDLLPPMRRARNKDFVERFIGGLDLDAQSD